MFNALFKQIVNTRGIQKCRAIIFAKNSNPIFASEYNIPKTRNVLKFFDAAGIAWGPKF